MMYTFFKKAAICLVAVCAFAGCADSPEGAEVQKALGETIRAEMKLAGVELGQIPNGKTFVTNFSDAREFVIAKKVGNVPGRTDCIKCDITVSRPTSKWNTVHQIFSGDVQYEKNVMVCVPK